MRNNRHQYDLDVLPPGLLKELGSQTVTSRMVVVVGWARLSSDAGGEKSVPG